MEGHKAVGSWLWGSHCLGAAVCQPVVMRSCAAGGCQLMAVVLLLGVSLWVVSNCMAAICIVIIAYSLQFSSSVSVNSFYLNPPVLFCF